MVTVANSLAHQMAIEGQWQCSGTQLRAASVGRGVGSVRFASQFPLLVHKHSLGLIDSSATCSVRQRCQCDRQATCGATLAIVANDSIVRVVLDAKTISVSETNGMARSRAQESITMRLATE